jgi:Spy/CpxP family protein refolding chaperone
MGAALAGVLAVGGVALAQPHHGGPDQGGIGFLLHGVNLTDAQKTQIHQIEKASWTTLKPLMQQERTLREQEVTQFLAAGAVTADQFSSIKAQEESVRTQIEAAHLNTMLQVRGVLTAEQISKAATLHAQMEQLHEQEHALLGAPEGVE